MLQHQKTRRAKRGCRCRRHGAALVEFSVCLPILITIVLGSIEASRLIHIRHGLETAAYEAAREVAAHPEASVADVNVLVASVLDAYDVTNGTITFAPSTLNTVSAGEQITVTVTAPVAGNRVIAGWIPEWLLTTGSLSAQCTALRG